MENEIYYEYDVLINKLNNLALEGGYVFRGYSKQEQMLPGLIRNNAIDCEKELLFKFEKYARSYIRTSSPIDFWSDAQHYGLSTRLLDFTANPYIALYFSLYNDKEDEEHCCSEDREFYYIRYCKTGQELVLRDLPITHLWTNDGYSSLADDLVNVLDKFLTPYCQKGNLDDHFLKTISNRLIDCESLEEVQKKINEDRLLLLDPHQSNPRIIMQQGLFMICYSLNKERHMEIINNDTSLVKIHKSLRPTLMTFLNSIGVNTYRLMPDLMSVCKMVEKQVRNEHARALADSIPM